MLFMQSHHLKTKDKQSIKLNSFFGYERGGSRKMISYELQRLHIEKRENKTTTKHGHEQQHLTNTGRDSYLWLAL